MKKIVILVLSTLLLTAASIQAGAATAPLSTPELKKMIGSNGKATLIFFQNPYGAPCIKQKEILGTLLKSRQGNFNIADVSTLNKNDHKAFYDYGVRSLPSLVLVDKKGNIGRVFSPGIQSAETLTAALDGAK